MTSNLSSLLRSGLIALGVAAGVSAPASAVPIAAGFNPAAQPAAQGNAGITLVQEGGGGRFSACKRDGRCGPRVRDGWRYRGIEGGRSWRRDRDRGDRWRYRRHWRGDGDRWRDRRYWRRHYRRGWYDNDWYGGSGIYLGFGVPGFGYYDPYYAPRYYAPRRVYRGGLSSAHVQWCYDRYRSYRAYDNTFQPYSGPRRQCWSPYS